MVGAATLATIGRTANGHRRRLAVTTSVVSASVTVRVPLAVQSAALVSVEIGAIRSARNDWRVVGAGDGDGDGLGVVQRRAVIVGGAVPCRSGPGFRRWPGNQTVTEPLVEIPGQSDAVFSVPSRIAGRRQRQDIALQDRHWSGAAASPAIVPYHDRIGQRVAGGDHIGGVDIGDRQGAAGTVSAALVSVEIGAIRSARNDRRVVGAGDGDGDGLGVVQRRAVVVGGAVRCRSGPGFRRWPGKSNGHGTGVEAPGQSDAVFSVPSRIAGRRQRQNRLQDRASVGCGGTRHDRTCRQRPASTAGGDHIGGVGIGDRQGAAGGQRGIGLGRDPRYPVHP